MYRQKRVSSVHLSLNVARQPYLERNWTETCFLLPPCCIFKTVTPLQLSVREVSDVLTRDNLSITFFHTWMLSRWQPSCRHPCNSACAVAINKYACLFNNYFKLCSSILEEHWFKLSALQGTIHKGLYCTWAIKTFKSDAYLLTKPG